MDSKIGAVALATNIAARMDEAALIRAAQGGDRVAFEQLVRAYDQSVLRLAYNLLRSTEDASDIYQETFLRVFRNLHSFRFDCSFHTWLYRIVTNLCLDHLRKRKVRKEESTMVPTAEGPVDRMDTVAEERVDGNPQRNLLSGELKVKIQEVLESLTPRERMVFEMRHYQGMRLRAIGEGPRHHRGSRQELSVSGDTKDAGGVRRVSMTCEEIRGQLSLLPVRRV